MTSAALIIIELFVVACQEALTDAQLAILLNYFKANPCHNLSSTDNY